MVGTTLVTFSGDAEPRRLFYVVTIRAEASTARLVWKGRVLATKSISILTPCFNEEDNVREVYERVRQAMVGLGRYRYEHLFIDNASTDNTFAILKELAEKDRNVKVIRNTRNFGHIRSPMHAMAQTTGDCVIGIVADLQDPPEMIPDLRREVGRRLPGRGLHENRQRRKHA